MSGPPNGQGIEFEVPRGPIVEESIERGRARQVDLFALGVSNIFRSPVAKGAGAQPLGLFAHAGWNEVLVRPELRSEGVSARGDVNMRVLGVVVNDGYTRSPGMWTCSVANRM